MFCSMFRRCWPFVVGWALTACLSWNGLTQAAEVTVDPPVVRFDDAFARRQLLVAADGADVTHASQYSSSDPSVAQVDDQGYVTPIAPGKASITIAHAGEKAAAAIEVLPFNAARPVDFANEIEPILSRLGCNSGGCHGKASGQNGFKLSLFGFDTTFDFQAIVSEARGRRVFPAAPDRSLLLTKATGQSPHGGGRRLSADSEAYQVLRRWITQGMPASAPDAPTVAKLHITPQQRSLTPDALQQLRVEVEYSDGTRRDVTRHAQYASNLDVVASVDERGLVTCGQDSGEAAIMARYMGQVAVFQALVPHAAPSGQPAAADQAALDAELANFTQGSYIDRLVAEKWQRLGLAPSPIADDATYQRRVTLDLCGRLPKVEEVRAFQSDSAADKREQLVDRLLATPDYPTFFALRWGSILRNSNLAGSEQAAYAFHNWIKNQVAGNRPYDEFVRGVVAAAGEWQDAPAINWYWQMRDDQLHQVTADTAQVFLGLRLQCARCHHHPYERWSQDDYYGLSGFFTRLGRKSFGEPPPYFSAPNVTLGERHPRTGQSPEPKYLDGDYVKFTPEEDPRHALVDWMVQPENPFFARTLVNRLWGHFLGRGLVDPVDDMRETNPPSNPALLDALAHEFTEHKFDVRHVIRQIVLSRTYQLSSEPAPGNQFDRQNHARFYARRMIAEVMLDSLDQACGTRSGFNGVSASARAIDLPHENFGSYFLDTFDRPRRVTGCECERSAGATIGQVLLLANSDEVENKIAAGDGRVARLLKEMKSPPEIVEELYLATFGRAPTAVELDKASGYITDQPDTMRQQAVEDVLWSLLNSREFAFNH
ncbi:MAG: DUF1549 domain-containing protein [Pirellulales bacterium]